MDILKEYLTNSQYNIYIYQILNKTKGNLRKSENEPMFYCMGPKERFLTTPPSPILLNSKQGVFLIKNKKEKMSIFTK